MQNSPHRTENVPGTNITRVQPQPLRNGRKLSPISPWPVFRHVPDRFTFTHKRGVILIHFFRRIPFCLNDVGNDTILAAFKRKPRSFIPRAIPKTHSSANVRTNVGAVCVFVRGVKSREICLRLLGNERVLREPQNSGRCAVSCSGVVCYFLEASTAAMIVRSASTDGCEEGCIGSYLHKICSGLGNANIFR